MSFGGGWRPLRDRLVKSAREQAPKPPAAPAEADLERVGAAVQRLTPRRVRGLEEPEDREPELAATPRLGESFGPPQPRDRLADYAQTLAREEAPLTNAALYPPTEEQFDFARGIVEQLGVSQESPREPGIPRVALGDEALNRARQAELLGRVRARMGLAPSPEYPAVPYGAGLAETFRHVIERDPRIQEFWRDVGGEVGTTLLANAPAVPTLSREAPYVGLKSTVTLEEKEQVGRDVGGAIGPSSPIEIAVELFLPGVGTGPDAARLIRAGGREGITAARRAAMSPEGKRLLRELASESGELRFPEDAASKAAREASEGLTPPGSGLTPSERGVTPPESITRPNQDVSPVGPSDAGTEPPLRGVSTPAGEMPPPSAQERAAAGLAPDATVGAGSPLAPPERAVASAETPQRIAPRARAPEIRLLTETGELVTDVPRPGPRTFPGQQPPVQGVIEGRPAPKPPGVGGADPVGPALERLGERNVRTATRLAGEEAQRADRAWAALVAERGRAQPVQGVSLERRAADGARGEDIVGAQLERDAALYERAFGETEPPDLPAPVSVKAAENAMPRRQQYIDQVTDMQTQLDAAKERARAARDAYAAQASRRTAVKQARAKGMTEIPEGMLSKNEIVASDRAVSQARQQLRQAKRVQLEADVRTSIEDFAERAEGLGADETATAAVVRAYRDAVELASDARQYADAPQWRKLIAKADAFVEGKVPDGVINAFARAHLVAGNALGKTTDEWLAEWSPVIERTIRKDGDALTFKGPSWAADLAEEFRAQAIVIHPEWWDGASTELTTLLAELKRFQDSRYAIVQAIDPRAAAALADDAPYLRTVWDIPESDLTARIARPSGRASVTKARAWPDPFAAMAQKNWPYKLKVATVSELVESSAQLADRQVATMLERKLVLERFGRRGVQPKASGFVQFRNPNYAGWWGPRDQVNFIDQLYEPAPAIVQQFGEAGSRVRNFIYGVADIGVFGQHVLQTIATNGSKGLAGAINRSLEALHLAHMQLYLNDDLPRAIQRELDGLPQGTLGSVSEPKGETVVSWIPGVGEAIDKPLSQLVGKATELQFAGVLTPLRNMVYEGNLMLAKAAGDDIAAPAVRRAASENSLAFSGGSLGALAQGRRQYERAFLGAPSITRSMAAQIGQVANIAAKGPTSTEGLQAIVTLANTAAFIYGVGSGLKMLFGDGKPIDPRAAFDPRNTEWATVQLGGEWQEVDGEPEYVGGQQVTLVPQKALLRALGKSVADIEQIAGGDPDGATKLMDAWGQFAFTRSNPLAQDIPAAALGTGFTTDGYFRPGGLSWKERAYNILPFPITGRSAVEGEFSTPEEIGPGVLGVGMHPGRDVEDAQREQKESVRAQIGEQGFTKIEQKNFDHEAWQAALAEKFGKGRVGRSENMAELRAEYVANVAPRLAERDGIPLAVAEDEAAAAFERDPLVKDFRAAIKRARLRWWQRHPDLLLDAAQTRVEELSDEEEKILREAGLIGAGAAP